jgi:hypothetical protein
MESGVQLEMRKDKPRTFPVEVAWAARRSFGPLKRLAP